MNAVADKHDLKRSINFHTKIDRAAWDDDTKRWVLTTSRGETIRSRYLIEAVGLLSSSYAPRFPDQDKFKGEILVASKWPETDPDLTGKKVAVVGTGSTGIQIITELAPKVGHLHVLQRTAQWVVPLGVGPFPQHARDRIRPDPIGFRDWALDTGTVFGFVEGDTSALAVSPQEREERYEKAWQKGNGFSFMLETFSDVTPDDDQPEPLPTDHRTRVIEVLLAITAPAFERFCQRLLREAGFQNVEVTGRSGDGGIDGMGILRVNALVSFKVLFQCKRYRDTVGPSQVRDFRGAMMGRADKGIILTTGTFTTEARREAIRDGVPPIELVDGERLADMLEELEMGLVPVRAYRVDEPFFAEFDVVPRPRATRPIPGASMGGTEASEAHGL
jgi:hypothetical protein